MINNSKEIFEHVLALEQEEMIAIGERTITRSSYNSPRYILRSDGLLVSMTNDLQKVLDFVRGKIV